MSFGSGDGGLPARSDWLAGTSMITRFGGASANRTDRSRRADRTVVSRIFCTFDQATASVCMTCGW